MTETLIHLLRHGEPAGGRAYRGHGVDDPLSDAGWQQMHQAAPRPISWDVVVTSPLERCHGFAKYIAEQTGSPLYIVDALKEIGFGEWEGKTPDQLKRQDPHGWAAYRKDPVNSRPAGSESLDSFRLRIDQAWQQLLADHAGKELIVVAHAGVLRAVVARILCLDHDAMQSIRIDYACWVRVRYQAGRSEVLCVNSPI